MIRLLISILFFISSTVLADEHIEYTGEPVLIGLAIGQERQIVFEESVKAGVPGTIINDLKLSSIGNRLFIEPLNEFSNQRLLVKGAESGTTYVITIQTFESDSLDPKVNIYLPRPEASPKHRDQAWSGSDMPINSYPFLTRYAMQFLYAPERLVKRHSAIQQITLPPKPVMIFRCTPRSSACRSIKATPMVGFKTDRLFATALKLENISSQAMEIDPRLVRVPSPNNLLTASTMHGRLLPKETGTKSQTVMVIIHNRPFRELMGGAW
ncbi:MAG: DUF3438 family protein [Methyloprofundus sp.]|nr:DUF3438 family protein [Methyloprofundus sp.]